MKTLYALASLVCVNLALPSAIAYETITLSEWSLTPMLEARVGLQNGENINFGLGAFDNTAEKQRTNGSMSFEPALAFERPAFGGALFGKASVVAAANLLEGELSGQFARGGDSRIDTDEFYVGWRSDSFSVSLGLQRLMISNGFLIGDGSFDTGADQGQYWVAPFDAWQNAAVATFTGDAIRGDVFWLQSDGGFGDTRLYGVNVENVDGPRGR